MRRLLKFETNIPIPINQYTKTSIEGGNCLKKKGVRGWGWLGQFADLRWVGVVGGGGERGAREGCLARKRGVDTLIHTMQWLVLEILFFQKT